MGVKFWYFATGNKGKFWNEFYENGFVALNSVIDGDLRNYTNKDAIENAFVNIGKAEENNNVLADYDICYDMKIGDVIIAKTGRSEILGIGKVISDYQYVQWKENYNSRRRVEWIISYKKDVKEYGVSIPKTLTNVTDKHGFILYINSLIEEHEQQRYPFVANAIADAKHRKAVEEAAINAAWQYLEKSNYTVTDRQDDNCGYDLEATKGKETLHVEVKGTSCAEENFYISRNEYDFMQNHKKSWRLFMVTSALNKPKLKRYKADEVEQKFNFTPLSYKADLKKIK